MLHSSIYCIVIKNKTEPILFFICHKEELNLNFAPTIRATRNQLRHFIIRFFFSHLNLLTSDKL